jgi:hypothetical protein
LPSVLGLAGVRNWLETIAATTYAVPSDTQRERITELLATDSLGQAQRRTVAFHAGIHRLTAPARVPENDAPAVTRSSPPRRWLRLLRRH